MISEFLLAYKAIGEENAIATRDITRALNISKRNLAFKVLKERTDGAPICAKSDGDGGYYMPATKEEIIHQKNALESRIKKHALALRPFRRKLKEYKESEAKTNET